MASKKDKLKEAGDAVLKKPRKSRKKEELKATSVVVEAKEGKPVSTIQNPPVPVQNRKIVPHLLVQEVQNLRNDVDSLKALVESLLASQAKK